MYWQGIVGTITLPSSIALKFHIQYANELKTMQQAFPWSPSNRDRHDKIYVSANVLTLSMSIYFSDLTQKSSFGDQTHTMYTKLPHNISVVGSFLLRSPPISLPRCLLKGTHIDAQQTPKHRRQGIVVVGHLNLHRLGGIWWWKGGGCRLFRCLVQYKIQQHGWSFWNF